MQTCASNGLYAESNTMAVHDWTRVKPGIFHDFHHGWIEELKRALNRGLLPADHYALAEQIAGGLGPDVLRLETPANGSTGPHSGGGGTALATSPPPVWFRARTEIDQYASKAKGIVIHHSSDHRVVAVLEIVSPGNKSSRHGLRGFVEKAVELMRRGIHLLIVDLFPPGPCDPQGIHKAIWDEFVDNTFVLPSGKALTLAAYVGGPCPETFVEPTTVGLELSPMPLFLTPEEYVSVPLEQTYGAAWDGVPAYWRTVLEKPLTAEKQIN
jgi:Protein of unknown function (DUF4058)